MVGVPDDAAAAVAPATNENSGSWCADGGVRSLDCCCDTSTLTLANRCPLSISRRFGAAASSASRVTWLWLVKAIFAWPSLIAMRISRRTQVRRG